MILPVCQNPPTLGGETKSYSAPVIATFAAGWIIGGVGLIKHMVDMQNDKVVLACQRVLDKPRR